MFCSWFIFTVAVKGNKKVNIQTKLYSIYVITITDWSFNKTVCIYKEKERKRQRANTCSTLMNNGMI